MTVNNPMSKSVDPFASMNSDPFGAVSEDPLGFLNEKPKQNDIFAGIGQQPVAAKA